MMHQQGKSDSILEQIRDWKQADPSRTVELAKLPDVFSCRVSEKGLFGQNNQQPSPEQAFEKAKASLVEAQSSMGGWRRIQPIS